MTLGKDYTAQDCSIARSLEIVGERWSLLIIRDALYGVRRYNDFLVHLGIPRASLATRLHALTLAGILEKRRYQQSPPRDEYVVTDRGLALWPTLRSLSVWGRDHVRGNNTRTFRHADCGAELGPYGECPSCRMAVAPGQVEMVPGPDLDPFPSDPVSQALLRPKRLLEPLVIGNG
jgi:DNA-binding HxlR family transcriptional regulator